MKEYIHHELGPLSDILLGIKYVTSHANVDKSTRNKNLIINSRVSTKSFPSNPSLSKV